MALARGGWRKNRSPMAVKTHARARGFLLTHPRDSLWRVGVKDKGRRRGGVRTNSRKERYVNFSPPSRFLAKDV